jgi:hypothetical protein
MIIRNRKNPGSSQEAGKLGGLKARKLSRIKAFQPPSVLASQLLNFS